jgi:outer membrane protein assembly factor BamB
MLRRDPIAFLAIAFLESGHLDSVFNEGQMKAKLIFYLVTALLANNLSALAQSEGTVLWTYDAGHTIFASPARALDGTVYLGLNTGLRAITNAGPFGSSKWTFAASGVTGSPAIGADGTIYFGGTDGNLYAVNPNGSLKWFYPASGGGSPAIGFDDTIYFQGVYYLHAVTNPGALKWKAPIPGTGNFSSPIVAPDGTIYVTCWEEDQLYSIAPDGTRNWVRELQTDPGGSPALANDGTIYVTGGFLYSFDVNGNERWRTGNFSGASPVVSPQGQIYARHSDHRLYCLGPTGQVLWQSVQDGALHHPAISPAIDAAGRLYYCASNSVFALNAQGAVLWSVYGGQPSLPGEFLAHSSPIVGDDGIIYAGVGTKLYAIASGTNRPADSGWPMYGQNPRHTGKLEKPALNKPQKRSDRNFHFQLYSQVGKTNTVESSSNLTLWTSLTDIIVTNVPMEIVDLSASNFITRFYRVVSP